VQKKQDVLKKKGAKFNPWVISDPKEKSLPVAKKNDKCIRHELLDHGWIKTQLEDNLQLQVFDPREADDSADIPLEEIDPELKGRDADLTVICFSLFGCHFFVLLCC
jgi:hypothetical protein